MKLANFNWPTGLFILGYHFFLLIALPVYFLNCVPSLGMIITSCVLLYVSGISVTATYHRLYSHPTYKIHPVAEVIFLFFSTMATQGSAIRWSFEHRHHHAFVDTDRDPYSIKKGFWYAHFLWMFEKPKKIEDRVVADLLRNPLLRFQHKFYPQLMVLTNVIAFLVVGWFFSDYLGAFILAWFTRLFFLHHFTWFINSLAHTWGSRHFCQELSAADNYLISLVTFGEGYHNYHHTFANDYRNGIRWYHFDPTKWLIWTLHKCRLAYNLKRVNSFHVDEKIVLDRKELLQDKIRSSFVACKEEWEEKVSHVADSILEKLKHMKQLHDSRREILAKKEGNKECLQQLSYEIKLLKKSLRQEFQQWMSLSRTIMAQAYA